MAGAQHRASESTNARQGIPKVKTLPGFCSGYSESTVCSIEPKVLNKYLIIEKEFQSVDSI